jgi:4-hydroxybenzoate polyprenyltransferase
VSGLRPYRVQMMARARFLALSSHPGPTIAVTTLAVLLGIGVHLSPDRLLLLAVAIACGQLSIGWSNDWIDAARDEAVSRADKPIAQGTISVEEVRTAALTAAVLTAPLSFLLGALAGVVHCGVVASGWSYNAVLKRTAWSVAPFIASFGLLPAVVTLSSTPQRFAAPWGIAVGAVFGVAIHFTNVLPDLQDDARTGVDGLPHRLGRMPSGLAAFVALALAALITLVGPVASGAQVRPSALAYAAFLACFTIAVWGVVLVLTRSPSRLLFQLIIVASLLVAGQLALNGTSLFA